MLFNLLLGLLILDSFVLVAAVLLQAGKGGGVAASFGGASSSADAFIGTRQAGNLLTKASWVGGGLFIFLAFVLQLMSTRARVPQSVLDQPLTQTPASTTPTKSGSAPALPLEPAQPKGAPPAPASGKAAPTTPARTTPAPTTPAPAPPKR